MKITSLQNNLIKNLVTLKNKKNREEQQLFLLDDLDLLLEAHKKGLLVMILTSDKTLIKDYFQDIETYEVTAAIIDKIVDVKTSCGIVGVCRFFEFDTISCTKVIALDGVQDPGNGGTIVRSAHAFNFDLVLLSENCFDQHNSKFIRATKGSFFHIPCQRGDVYEKIKAFKESGYQVIITDNDPKAVAIDKFMIDGPFILVMGSEGNGVSQKVASLADNVVKIPIHEGVESLNVGVASAICMYVLSKK